MPLVFNRLTGLLLLAGLSSATLAATSRVAAPAHTYLVQFTDAPVASYQGGQAGLTATRPAEGARLDGAAPQVQAYRAHLTRRQDQVLSTLGAQVRPVHRYQLAFNGVALRLTAAQLKRLKAHPLVRNVAPDTQRRADTVSTAAFLGLEGPAGLWSRQRKGASVLGEDIIIAAIDTGVQPENPAFHDRVDANGVPVASGGTQVYGPPPARWKGGCISAPSFPASLCNNKLIGAKVFNSGWLSSGLMPWFGTFSDSARDEDGHGSHTLSTAGGNALAPAYDSRGVYLGSTSGMAPRARLAAYKALFRASTTDGVQSVGMTSDVVAAIEAAVADGVDVINFSVSGNPYSLIDPVALAFLGASDANVFVATSAGNAGQPYTIGHPSPWVTTVAATTHDRNPWVQLTLGNGISFTGTSFSATPLPASPLVLAQDAAIAGVSATQANWCAPNALDVTKVAGKIVVCDRGGIITRLQKSAEVKRAGGLGMVLLNTSESDLETDWHVVPTVQLLGTAREQVRSYAAGQGAFASMSARFQVPGLIAPVVASFSSRGPNAATDAVLKPDLSAPGVSIIAASAYQQRNQADNYAIRNGSMTAPAVDAMLDGTSMAAPHVAGLAALLKQLRPSWSPAAIKSALMTTGTQVKLADGSVDSDASGGGAGLVNPTAASDPGLVYPASNADYMRFLCREGWFAPTDTACQGVGMNGPVEVNQPSIAATFIGSHVAHRKVRNVGATASTYTATADVPGVDVTVSPSSLTLGKGETGEFTVKFSRSTAAYETAINGSITWSDGAHQVRSPVQLTVRELAAPDLVTSGEASGQQSFDVQYGFSGATSTRTKGLNPSTQVSTSIADGTYHCDVDTFTVVEGTESVRTSISANDLNIGVDNFFFWYTDANAGFYGLSRREGDGWVLEMEAPAKGDYSLCFWPLETPAGGVVNMTGYRTLMGPAHPAVGDFKVTGLPQRRVKLGQVANATASWGGLEAGRHYVGKIEYLRGDGSPAASTTVRIEPGAQALVRKGSALPARRVAPIIQARLKAQAAAPLAKTGAKRR